MWCSSKENEAGASSAGCVLERSVQSDVLANPCAPAPSPGLVGESVGLPNQGETQGDAAADCLRAIEYRAGGKPQDVGMPGGTP